MDQEEILEEESQSQLLLEAHARKFLYADVEELIEFGFLTHEIMLEGVHLVFRTLSPPEIRQCLLRGRSRAPGTLTSLRWFIAHSIWMIDGFEVSRDPKDNGPYHIYKDWVETLPNSIIEFLMSIYFGLRNRQFRAMKLIEAYCYEPYSRSLWRLLGRPKEGGLDNNGIKRIWVAHNLAEDGSREDTRQWSHTRMIVAAFTGKGAKELSKNLDEIARKEKEQQKKVIEEAVNWVIRGDRPEEEDLELEVGGKKVKIKKIYTPTSLDDLEGEMRKVFEGDADFHDLMVEDYHRRVRENFEARRKAQQEAYEESRRRLEEREALGEGASLVAYTREQLEQINPDVLKKKSTTTYSDNSEAHRIYDRYIGPKIVPGVLTPELKVVDPERGDPRRTGEKKEEVPLQERISSRKPTF